MPARRTGQKYQVNIRIPEDLYVELRVLLCDPRSGKPRYRTWGRAIEGALREWVDSKKVSKV